MKYGLIFYETSAQFSERESESAGQYWGAWSAYIDQLDDAGVLVRGAGAGLQVPGSATTLRATAGELTIQDGPVADTKEQLAGLVVINVPSLDEAMTWAKLAPCTEGGAVEVRPILPDPS